MNDLSKLRHTLGSIPRLSAFVRNSVIFIYKKNVSHQTWKLNGNSIWIKLQVFSAPFEDFAWHRKPSQLFHNFQGYISDPCQIIEIPWVLGDDVIHLVPLISHIFQRLQRISVSKDNKKSNFIWKKMPSFFILCKNYPIQFAIIQVYFWRNFVNARLKIIMKCNCWYFLKIRDFQTTFWIFFEIKTELMVTVIVYCFSNLAKYNYFSRLFRIEILKIIKYDLNMKKYVVYFTTWTTIARLKILNDNIL